MKFKLLKKELSNKKYLKYLNPNFHAKFSNVDFFILKKDKELFIIELNFYDKSQRIELLTKESFKELKLNKYPKYYQFFKTKEQKDFKPEKLMKISFYKELSGNYPNGSIISEYTHMDLNSRADFVVFDNGECHVFELKSKKDNLSKLKKQVKEYKKYATKIFVVINERHLKNYESLNIKGVNLIIETEQGFIVKEMNMYNYINKDLSKLIWHKEKVFLFSYVKNQKMHNLNQKMSKLKEYININELTFKILEERYKELSDSTRINYMDMFKKRDFSPCKKNIKFFYPELKTSFDKMFN